MQHSEERAVSTTEPAGLQSTARVGEACMWGIFLLGEELVQLV